MSRENGVKSGTDAAIAIRTERPGDSATISDVVARAYAAVPHSDHREHLMVERLRSTDAFCPALSLVAEVRGEAVGHILLTIASVSTPASSVVTLALAPLSVVPEHRSRGVGKRLVCTAHQRAADLGFGSVVLVGPPTYYKQFGYEPLGDRPITLPFTAPARNCMIFGLTPHALDGLAGVVGYADGWLEH